MGALPDAPVRSWFWVWSWFGSWSWSWCWAGFWFMQFLILFIHFPRENHCCHGNEQQRLEQTMSSVGILTAIICAIQMRDHRIHLCWVTFSRSHFIHADVYRGRSRKQVSSGCSDELNSNVSNVTDAPFSLFQEGQTQGSCFLERNPEVFTSRNNWLCKPMADSGVIG